MTIIELATQYGLNPKWKASTAGGEYCSPCPVCGGIDRFYMQPYRQMSKCIGFYSCRQCGTSGDSIQFARQFMNYSFQEAAQIVNANFPEYISAPILKKEYRTPLTVLKEPPFKWTQKATEYIQETHKQLLTNSKILASLAKRGISMDTIEHYKFGWCTHDNFYPASDWGLEEQSHTTRAKKIWIPQGLVIPIKKPTGEIIRLKIRRNSWQEGDKFPKYIAVPGSMNGLSLIGNLQHKIIIVVESELDAYAVHAATQGFALVVAVGSNIKNPDNVTDRLAKSSNHLLICHDNDAGGKTMLNKWQKLYPHAQSYPAPYGKDVGEYIETGGNINNFFNNIIKG